MYTLPIISMDSITKKRPGSGIRPCLGNISGLSQSAAKPPPVQLALAAAGLHPTRASYTQRHASHAQRGGARLSHGYSQEQLYSMPPLLCDEIAQAAEACNHSEEHAAHESIPEPS